MIANLKIATGPKASGIGLLGEVDVSRVAPVSGFSASRWPGNVPPTYSTPFFKITWLTAPVVNGGWKPCRRHRRLGCAGQRAGHPAVDGEEAAADVQGVVAGVEGEHLTVRAGVEAAVQLVCRVTEGEQVLQVCSRAVP